MGLATEGDNIGVCKACIKDADKLKDPTLPPLFGESNGLNPGPVPGFLPILTTVEELLIARVYVHLQVVRVRGQQHRYTGHVCCFSQNTPKTWRQLPRLPTELDILVVRPAAVEGGEYLSRRFTKRYTVRRSAIAQWLYFLKVNHPNYRDVEICSTWLTSLPENGSVLDQLPHINESESDSSGPTAHPTASMQRPPAINPLPAKLSSNILDGEFDDDVLDTLVPNLVPNLSKLELLGCEV
jgi:hypothetical protein